MEIYQDKRYSVDERAKNLLSLMTLDEKIEQMHVHNNLRALLEELENGTIKRFFGILFDVRATDKKTIHKIPSWKMLLSM